MEPDQIAKRLKEFEALCRRMGVPLTVQRQVILETVLDRDDHPTADQIVEAVRKRIARVSRTTVYRVLESLTDMGVIRRLHHPGPATRFDGKIGRHHHLICKKCGKVIDLEDANLDQLPLPKRKLQGFEVDDFSVHLSGTCADCRKETD
ncbi:MAG: Fur family transcriptional regulator [Pirellulaceae bacterium]